MMMIFFAKDLVCLFCERIKFIFFTVIVWFDYIWLMSCVAHALQKIVKTYCSVSNKCIRLYLILVFLPSLEDKLSLILSEVHSKCCQLAKSNISFVSFDLLFISVISFDFYILDDFTNFLTTVAYNL